MFKGQRGEPASASTIETLSYEETLAKLESLKREHKEFLKGHRKNLYRFLQRSAEAALSVEADENTTLRFRKKMDEKDILRGTLIFVFDAKTESEMKEASKRAQALRYLIDKLDIPAEDIAKAIPKNGGIEKLARLASKSRQDDSYEVQEDRDDDDQDGEVQEKAEGSVGADRQFGKQILVGLSPKLNKQLKRFADNARIKIIGCILMSSQGAPAIEVKKITEVKAKANKSGRSRKVGKKRDEDATDWED
jgi:hypothetical protein